MEVSVEKLKEDKSYSSEDYKVSIGDNRIFTSASIYSSFIAKYIGDMKKSHQRSNKNKHGVPLVVGFGAECAHQHSKESHYDILTLCVDSQCLIVQISNIVDPNDKHAPLGKDFPISLKDLLTDSNTILVGLGIEKVAKKFEKYYGFQLANTVDLKTLTIDGLVKDEDKDGKRRKLLRQCPLDDLLNEALGRELKIRRETKKIEMWRDGYYWGDNIHKDRVKHSTLDGFVAWKIGTKYLDLIKTKFLV